MIDWQAFVLFLLALACTVGGWFLRELWGAVETLKRDLSELTVEVSRQYVRRDDYREDMRELKTMVGEIWQAMKEKADKP